MICFIINRARKFVHPRVYFSIAGQNNRNEPDAKSDTIGLFQITNRAEPGQAFAGESQARTRYSIYAHKAKGEALWPSLRLEQVAGQELSHASVLLGRIAALAPAAPQN